MAGLLEDAPNQQTDSTLLNVGESGGLSDALGHLYSSVKSYMAPAAAPLSFSYADQPVGAESTHAQSLTMPSPDVSPLLGMFGDQPLTAATHARALNIASTLANFGPADVGAIKAFHGSPYDFSAFDASKIGTGEGAQAYGHGMYAAESEGVAQTYKASPNQKTMGPAATWVAKAGGDWNKALDMFNDFTKDLPQTDAQAQVRDALVKGNMPGHMYEVNIAADPEHMLDWDKPLSEQHPIVQERLADVLRLQKVPPKNNVGAETTGGQMMQYLEGRLGKEDAANELASSGVPGIKYLDQGSRGTGKGTSNYVVFDPATIAILRKYGIAGLIAGGGAAATQGGNGQNQ